MPHVPPDKRKSGIAAHNPGLLNYQFTECIKDYLNLNGLSYQTCNDIVGALENAKDEFQRLIQHPYEDKKIAENGNVYESENLRRWKV